MGFRGDTAALRELGEQMGMLSGGGLMLEASTSMATEALLQLKEGFRAGSDPYGSSWIPDKYRNGQILVADHSTDATPLRDSFSSAQRDGGFTISTDAPEAPAHQYGAKITRRSARPRKTSLTAALGMHTVKIPARPMVPERQPNLWDEPMEAKALEVFDRVFPP